MKVVAMNCFLSAVIGFGLAGYLSIHPENNPQSGQTTKLMVMFMSFSSGSGLVLAIAEIKKK